MKVPAYTLDEWIREKPFQSKKYFRKLGFDGRKFRNDGEKILISFNEIYWQNFETLVWRVNKWQKN
jgi:hypothetical protein